MRILVPTDFSDNAAKAVLYAAGIARRSGWTLSIVHAVALVHEDAYPAVRLHEKYNGIMLDERKKEMDILVESLLSVYDHLDVTTALVDGEPAEAITRYVKGNDIGLIVMGTKGAGGIKARLVGTVTACVVARSGVPVLVVPDAYEMEEPDGILFATNRFERNKRILAPLMNMARLFAATVYTIIFMDKEKSQATDYLEKRRELEHYFSFLRSAYPGVTINGEMIEGKEFENAVELFHAQHDTDMIALVSYPKSAWEKILGKSVTRKMIFHSHIPVLVMPAFTG